MTFGLGRLYLEEDRLERRFGLRVVLNVVDPERLHSVGSRVYEEVVISTTRQTSRAAARQTFTIDDTRDVLREVVGAPRDEAAFGRQLVGSDALSLSVPVQIEGVPDLLDRLAAVHESEAYKEYFAFIDFITPVRDRATRQRLDELALDAVAGRAAAAAYLAPPEPISFDDIEGFRHVGERRSWPTHPELELADYRARVDPERLTVDELRRHQVSMIASSTGLEVRRWSVYRCLVFEVELDGRYYLLSEGEWFAVDRDFVEELDRRVGEIRIIDLGLPLAARGEKEADYNRRAAAATGMTLLDRRMFGVGRTNIEVCDLLSQDGHLIHVKRKTQSATLSHLFAQGRVSAEALKVEPVLRRRVREAVEAESPTAASMLGADPFRARDLTVVYAVIAPNAAALPGRLPFFSRLNLVHATRFLSGTLDYAVGFAGVPIG